MTYVSICLIMWNILLCAVFARLFPCVDMLIIWLLRGNINTIISRSSRSSIIIVSLCNLHNYTFLGIQLIVQWYAYFMSLDEHSIIYITFVNLLNEWCIITLINVYCFVIVLDITILTLVINVVMTRTATRSAFCHIIVVVNINTQITQYKY